MKSACSYSVSASLDGTNSYVQVTESGSVSGARSIAACLYAKSGTGYGMPFTSGGQVGKERAGPAGGYTLTANHSDEGAPTQQAGDLFSENDGSTGAKLVWHEYSGEYPTCRSSILSKMSAHPNLGK